MCVGTRVLYTCLMEAILSSSSSFYLYKEEKLLGILLEYLVVTHYEASHCSTFLAWMTCSCRSTVIDCFFPLQESSPTEASRKSCADRLLKSIWEIHCVNAGWKKVWKKFLYYFAVDDPWLKLMMKFVSYRHKHTHTSTNTRIGDLKQRSFNLWKKNKDTTFFFKNPPSETPQGNLVCEQK